MAMLMPFRNSSQGSIDRAPCTSGNVATALLSISDLERTEGGRKRQTCREIKVNPGLTGFDKVNNFLYELSLLQCIVEQWSD